MGIEFLRTTPEQKKEVRLFVDALRSAIESAELQVEPDGLDSSSDEKPATIHGSDDSLVHLFHQQAQVSVEVFLEQMQQNRQLQESH